VEGIATGSISPHDSGLKYLAGDLFETAR